MLRVHKRVGMPPEYVPSASALFALDAQPAGKCARKTLAQSSASTGDVHDDAAGSDDHDDDDDSGDDEHSAAAGSAAKVAITSSKRRNASFVAEEAAAAAVAAAAVAADRDGDASASATLSATSTFKRMRLGDASEETKSALDGKKGNDKKTEEGLIDTLALPAPLRRRAERARKHAEQGRRAVLSYSDVEQLVQAAFDAGDAAGRQASQRTFEQQLLDMQRAFSKLADDYQAQAFGHLPPGSGGSGGSDARGSCSYIA